MSLGFREPAEFDVLRPKLRQEDATQEYVQNKNPVERASKLTLLVQRAYSVTVWSTAHGRHIVID
eukprot:6647005-Lingulodinium_polyedra.AAC.1